MRWYHYITSHSLISSSTSTATLLNSSTPLSYRRNYYNLLIFHLWEFFETFTHIFGDNNKSQSLSHQLVLKPLPISCSNALLTWICRRAASHSFCPGAADTAHAVISWLILSVTALCWTINTMTWNSNTTTQSETFRNIDMWNTINVKQLLPHNPF